jgi:flagellar assembly protein FliH
MSTSPSRAPLATSPAPSRENQPEIFPFSYGETSASFQSAGSFGRLGDSAMPLAELAAREASARELGRQQGEMEARSKFEEQLAREREVVAAAIRQFAQERSTYYQKLEAEVVKLALSIARHVLHREAQVDPLLLMGIVRVALGRIEGATGITLVIHPENSSDWRRYLNSHLEPGDVPEIIEDLAMAVDRCQIRTSMGNTDLGLEVQLTEIEHGLMDLLAARPQETR